MKTLKRMFSAALFLLLPLLPHGAAADVGETIKNAAEKTVEQAQNAAETVRDKMAEAKEVRARASWFVTAPYSPFDLILPSKIGFSAGFNRDENRSLEMEYLRGSLKPPGFLEHFGGVTEERVSLLWRTYLNTNSFNFFYGLHYGRFTLEIGNDMLGRVSGSAGSVDLLRMEALGGTLGFGNRWSFRNGLTMGVDWLAWAQPLYRISEKADFIDRTADPDDKQNAESVMRIATYLPRFSALKLHVGYTF